LGEVPGIGDEVTGRKRLPLTGDGSRVELARRLRGLRDASGLSLRALARKSGYSQAALSAAESGRRVPSWLLAEAFLQSCGQDPERWRQLWEVARDESPPADDTLTNDRAAGPVLGDRMAIENAEPPVLIPARRARRQPAMRSRLAWITVGAVIAGATASFLVEQSAAPAPRAADKPGLQRTTAAGSIPAHDGADPYASGCKPDHKPIDWVLMLRPDGTRFGMLILYYSAACQAEWGYVDGPNSTSWTVHIVVRRPGDLTSAPFAYSGTAPPGSWGNILSTRTGCVQAEAWVTDRHGSGPHATTKCMQGG
jgi:transcriptional regulator with XRE-family HTH domain